MGSICYLGRNVTNSLLLLSAKLFQEANEKLSVGENVKDDNGANHGYGWRHIGAGHGEQIRAAGFASVEKFVEAVARNYDAMRKGV